MYAVEGKAQIFKKYDFESKIILCYDNKNGPERENYLVNHVLEAVEKANKEYDENPREKPRIDDQWKKYMSIHVNDETFKKAKGAQKDSKPVEKPDASQKSKEEDKTQKVTEDATKELNSKKTEEEETGSPDQSQNEKEASPMNQSSHLPIKQYSNPYCSINEEALQKAAAEKGFSCMAISDDMSAKTAVKLYDLRDKNEKLYMVIKSQLGSEVARVWYTSGVESKHLIVMIASLLRHKLEDACKKCGYILTSAIRELSLLVIQRTSDDVYFAVNNANAKQEELMAIFNVSYESLMDLAAQETNRVKKIGVWEQVHKMTRPEKPEAKDKNPEENPEPKKRGRPKGSTKKNTTTEETEEKVAKKRGRPLGSKNKPKSEKEEKKATRKPGRPKGSKNKKGAVNAKAKRAAAKAKAENAG